MKIFHIISNLISSNMYVLEENNHLILIDPCIIDIRLENKTVDYIFLTHEHYDHISGVITGKKSVRQKLFAVIFVQKILRVPGKIYHAISMLL